MQWLLTRLLACLKQDQDIYFVGVLNEYMCKNHRKDYARWVTQGLHDEVAYRVIDMILDYLYAPRAWRQVAERTGAKWFLIQLLAALEQDEAIHFVGAINVQMCRAHPDGYARWVIEGLNDDGVHVLTDLMLDHLAATRGRREAAAFLAQRKRDILHLTSVN